MSSREPLRIAVAQTEISCDPRLNGHKIRAQMRQAAASGARLSHFTEGAMSGYPSGAFKQVLAGWPVDWASWREELEATAALAGELGLWTVVGAAHPLSPPNRP